MSASAVAAEARVRPPARAHGQASVWELARREMRIASRGGGYRVLAALLAVWTVCGLFVLRYIEPGLLRVGPAAGSVVRGTLESCLLLLAPLLVGGAVIREHRLGMEELLLSKPPSSEALAWSKFLGALGALVLLVLLTSAVAAIAMPLLYWPDVAVLPIVLGALRVLPPLLFISGISFCLATYLRSAMVGGLMVVLQLGLLAAASLLIPVVRFTLTPYHPAYALLGLAFVGLAAGGWQRGRDPHMRLSRSWTLALACLTASVVLGILAANRWSGWTLDGDPPLVGARAPGRSDTVRIPDAIRRTVDGDLIRTSRWSGKPVVIVFWSASGASGAVEAAVLERAWRDAAPDRLGFVTVCVTDDPGRGADLARTAGLRTPVLWNAPAQSEEARGLAAVFGLTRDPQQALASVLRPDGTISGQPAAVSQFPWPAPVRPPHRDWERRLHDLAVAAFRRLAERGP